MEGLARFMHSTIARFTCTQSCHNLNSPTPSPSSTTAKVEMQISFELAAQAEALPDKPTRYMAEFINKPRVRGALLRHGKTLQFNRTTNKDAILAFTRGDYLPVKVQGLLPNV